MITHFEHGRCSNLVISLAECPWLAGTDAQLPGYVYRKYVFEINKAKRSAELEPGVKIYCFESTQGNYVIELNYADVTDEVRQRTRAALEKWSEELYIPKSCKIDPTTGRYPVTVAVSDEFI